jgi:hypothetical protein
MPRIIVNQPFKVNGKNQGRGVKICRMGVDGRILTPLEIKNY